MLQWLVGLSEFPEFTESLFYLEKTPMLTLDSYQMGFLLKDPRKIGRFCKSDSG